MFFWGGHPQNAYDFWGGHPQNAYDFWGGHPQNAYDFSNLNLILRLQYF